MALAAQVGFATESQLNRTFTSVGVTNGVAYVNFTAGANFTSLPAISNNMVPFDVSAQLSDVVFGALPRPNSDYFYFTDAVGNKYRTAAEVDAAGAKATALWVNLRRPGFTVILR